MKRNQLKSLIREEVQKVRLALLDESIVSDIISLILTPKVKKAMKALKADPEFQELEKQAKLAQQELEAINKRIERNLEKRQKLVDDMKKSGVDVRVDMNADQIYNAYKKWQSKESAKIGRPEWAKYFK